MIYIASDHAGFSLKKGVSQYLKERRIDFIDLGCDSEESCNYPDFGHELARRVLENQGWVMGIGICGSGLGMSMALNRHNGIRAARCVFAIDAELARKHNDANVLVLPGRQITLKKALSMLEIFLVTPFEGGRHRSRVEKIDLK
jgi:ribose 5-phosphate isomerase B